MDSIIVGESHGLENPSNLIQWAVLFALALQIPKLLEEIRLIIDLHYHSFPLLVILGTFPSFLKRTKNVQVSNDSAQILEDKSCSFKSSGLLYNESSTSLNTQSEVLAGTSSSDFSIDGDEWGHFADLDGSMMGLEQEVKLTGSPSSRMKLMTLAEEAEEEE